MQLLLAHHAGLSVLIYPVKAMEWSGRDLGKPNRSMIYKLDDIVGNTSNELKSHLEWPLSMYAGAKIAASAKGHNVS